uniref:Uncharacterized protein n=1 Tax=Rhizophora mucronata TaxID=61149 RepID=A0A2P2JZS8_RHIMU
MCVMRKEEKYAHIFIKKKIHGIQKFHTKERVGGGEREKGKFWA